MTVGTLSEQPSKAERLAFAAYLVDLLGQGKLSPNRTQLHKAAYFLDAMAHVPHGFPFALYLHGPYSRELDTALGELQAIGWLKAERDSSGYGARYSITDLARQQLPKYTNRLRTYESIIRSVGEEVLPRTVTELELLSTVWYVQRSKPDAGEEAQISAVRELKPHFSNERIRQGFAEVKDLASRVLEKKAA